jgi:hypothetical protein
MATSNGSIQKGNGQDRSQPSVFVSYSHKDEDWKKRLVKHLDALVRARRIAVWHDRMIEAGDDWNDEIRKAMSEAAFAVCLVSSDYLSSEFCLNQEISFFLHRREQDGLIIIPILLRPCPWYAFDWLSALQMLPRDGKCVVEDFPKREEGVFETVARQIFDTAASPDYRPPKARVEMSARPEKIDIVRLPPTGRELFVRQEEIALLDEAWASDDTHVVSLVAWGASANRPWSTSGSSGSRRTIIVALNACSAGRSLARAPANAPRPPISSSTRRFGFSVKTIPRSCCRHGPRASGWLS